MDKRAHFSLFLATIALELDRAHGRDFSMLGLSQRTKEGFPNMGFIKSYNSRIEKIVHFDLRQIIF